ncbi:hypothetical protein KW784_02065 [Candidatus Parcubacteria bacterium]|nr:hypothetical protein [Candidatus Parcubacteria bacterium]
MAPIPGWKPLTNFCDPLLKVGEISKANPPLPRCDISQVVQLIKYGIQDLVIFSTLLLVAAAVYAGIKLVTSQGNPNALKEAGTMLRKIVFGYAVILVAWVLVYTITSTLLNADFNFLLKGSS